MPMPVFNDNNELVQIEVSEVFTIYKDPKTRRIVVTAECGRYYLPSTIEEILKIMARSGFAKIDKNRIINVAQVKSFIRGEAHVDGSYFTVSRRNRENLRMLIENRSRNTNGHFPST